MYTEKIIPRFAETDALGHINNISIVGWFEHARRPIFETFVPGLSPKNWTLILAKIELDFLAQVYFEQEVTVNTYFEKLGNSSMTVIHEAFQNGEKVATGKAIMVHFDYATNTSARIPDDIRATLEKHVGNS
jgi:acyl-CoA thioester hydrolase